MQKETAGTFTNRNGEAMTAQAFYALKAAQAMPSWGRDAAIRYTMNHAQISYAAALRLITIARQLLAIDRCLDMRKSQAATLPSFLRKQAS